MATRTPTNASTIRPTSATMRYRWLLLAALRAVSGMGLGAAMASTCDSWHDAFSTVSVGPFLFSLLAVPILLSIHARLLRRSARLRRLPSSPACAGNDPAIPVYETRDGARLVGFLPPATTFGFGRLGIIVVSADFQGFPAPVQEAILLHERAHAVQYHPLCKVALLTVVLTGMSFVPVEVRSTWCGVLLFVAALAIGAAFARWTEYQADRAVRRHVGPHATLAMLAALDESAWYRRLEWLPGFSLLYPHPSLASRGSRLYWDSSE